MPKNVSLIFVSLDLKKAYPTEVNDMKKKLKLVFPVVWLDETNADYFCPKVDKAWMGGIPSTLLVNPKTGYRKFFEQQLKAEDFERELKKAL